MFLDHKILCLSCTSVLEKLTKIMKDVFKPYLELFGYLLLKLRVMQLIL